MSDDARDSGRERDYMGEALASVRRGGAMTFDLSMLPNAANLEADEGERSAVRGIGMSDLGAVLGLEGAFGTPLSIWRRLVGMDGPTSDNWHMKQGRAMEETILRDWCERTGTELVYPCPRLRLKDHPHIVFSLDAIGIKDGKARILEAKYPGHGWETPPQSYVCQVIGQMGCSGLTDTPAALIHATRFSEPVDEPVVFDADLFQMIIGAVNSFWTDHVLANVPPDPTTPDERATVALSKLRKGLPALAATEEHEALALMVQEVYEAEKQAKARKEEMSARMAEAMALAGVEKIEAKGRWTMTLVEKEGAVSWKKAAEAAGVTEEQANAYRGEPTKYVLFKASSKKEK